MAAIALWTLLQTALSHHETYISHKNVECRFSDFRARSVGELLLLLLAVAAHAMALQSGCVVWNE